MEGEAFLVRPQDAREEATIASAVREQFEWRIKHKYNEHTQRMMDDYVQRSAYNLCALGCDILRVASHGAAYEVMALPQLTLILNVTNACRNAETWWWILRLAVDKCCPTKRKLTGPVCEGNWDDDASQGSARICEATNCVVHMGCWPEHIKNTALELFVRGCRILGRRFLDVLHHVASVEEEESETRGSFSS